MVYQGGFTVFDGFWLVFMVFKVVSRFFMVLVGFHGFQGGFMVYHGFWLVSMFFSRWFHGLSWFLVGFHGFVS